MVDDVVSEELLDRYFSLAREALEVARGSVVNDFGGLAVDMASRYVSDAEFFRSRGDFVLALSALNYAHGWLDSAARFGFLDVSDSRLFAVDD